MGGRFFNCRRVIAAAVWHFKRGKSDAPQYQTTAVERGDLSQVVTATGTLNPVVNVTVGSQVSGIINKLNVDFNSMVKSNEVIAEIDPSTYRAAVAQATADLANAKANLELQQAEAARSAELFTNKLISSSDYDTAIATRTRPRLSANQTSLAGQRQRKSGLLQNPFTGGWHCDFTRD